MKKKYIITGLIVFLFASIVTFLALDNKSTYAVETTGLTYKVYYTCGSVTNCTLPSPNPTVSNSKLISLPTNPTANGYTFSHWSWGSSTYCNSGCDFNGFYLTGGATQLTVTANWVPISSSSSSSRPSSSNGNSSSSSRPSSSNGNSTYTLNFNCGSGVTCSHLPSTVTSTSNQITIPQQRPTRSGYTFGYWMINGSSYQYFEPGSTIFLNAYSTVTLYAFWIPNTSGSPSSSNGNSTYRLNFNCGSGVTCSHLPSTVTSTSNQITIPQQRPTRSGYTFGYWMINGLSYQYFEPGSTIFLNAYSTVTLYAFWIPNTSGSPSSSSSSNLCNSVYISGNSVINQNVATTYKLSKTGTGSISNIQWIKSSGLSQISTNSNSINYIVKGAKTGTQKVSVTYKINGIKCSKITKTISVVPNANLPQETENKGNNLRLYSYICLIITMCMCIFIYLSLRRKNKK